MAGGGCAEFDVPVDRAGGPSSITRASLRRLAASLVFLAGLTVILGVLHFVLVPTSPTEWMWKDYLSLSEGSLDVVNIGNSHLQCSVAPMQMWSDYGIASWNLTAGGINSATKLAYAQEALQTQTPDVLTLEVHSIEMTTLSTDTRNDDAYSFMPWGMPKVKAIAQTAPPSAWQLLAFRLMTQHQRYPTLTVEDYDPRVAAERASDGGANALDIPPDPGGEVAARNAIPWRIDPDLARENLAFIRLAAMECEQRGVSLLIWLAPVDGGYTDESDPLRWIESQLATEYPDIIYVNTNDNWDEIGLEHRDFRDRGHLYAWGMEKTTRWLAESVLLDLVEPSAGDNPDSEWWDTNAAMWNPPSYEEASAQW